MGQFPPLPTLIAIAVCGLSGFAANMFYFEMIDKINERVSEKEQISWIWWGTEVRGKYRRLYPEGRLTRYADGCTVLMVISIFFSFWYS